ncbi:MAG TPA: hypothetical protein VF313_12340 [Anaerolineaceae bacterium]
MTKVKQKKPEKEIKGASDRSAVGNKLIPTTPSSWWEERPKIIRPKPAEQKEIVEPMQEALNKTRTIIPEQTTLKPTHLSLFALENATGHPIVRMPVYAEVGIAAAAPIELPPGNIDVRLTDAIPMAIREVNPNCFADNECRKRLNEAMLQALSRLLTKDAVDKLVQDGEAKIQDAALWILNEAKKLAGGDTLKDLDPEALLKDLRDAIRAFAQANNLELVQTQAPDVVMVWAHPLGILATDHVGYLSFDLTRLPTNVYDAVVKALEARRRNHDVANAVSIWLYPMALEGLRVDALAQGRFADDAILVKLELDSMHLPDVLKNMGLPAMQKPSLTDWRLSAASFAANPYALLGKEGCENILPANLAIQEFYFYQVVRLTDQQNQLPNSVRDRVQARLGFINDYSTSWYSLGHSLGQILYSMPLAPGESVNLAVVDWTRRDKAQRAEDTKVTEQLVHNEHRDRTISETVNAALQEWQHGSSFMGGVALSAGVSAVLSSGAGIAAGLAGSLGGSTATSEGTRNLTANTVQKLSDNITQVSSSARELQSTVIVQSTQEEKEAIQTRTVVNYNHSHALTILYYEVLRHFRIVTQLLRRRPALLVYYELQPFFFDQPSISSYTAPPIRQYTTFLFDNRAILKSNLLDPKYAEGFDALERIAHRSQVATATKEIPPPAPLNPNEKNFIFFTFRMKTGGLFHPAGSERPIIEAKLVGPTPPVQLVDSTGNSRINEDGSFAQAYLFNTFTAKLNQESVKWSTISAISLNIKPGGTDYLSFSYIQVIAHDEAGTHDATGRPGITLIDQSYEDGNLYISPAPYGADILLPTLRPPPQQPSPRPADEIEDEAKLIELFDHLEHNKEYYNRVVWLNEDAYARAARFDAIRWDASSTLLDHLENRPVEIIGQWVAFPTADCSLDKIIQGMEASDPCQENPSPILDERLVTLPTRGIFAEAKLGHCNASEEIDNTRFWDWQQSPIPHMAPEIAPVTPVTPQPQQPNLQVTPFPSSLVNIVNPPAAPDPTGLTAALNVLGTPNIFRDMSGRAEVADLLKKLSDNTISIAGAANKAREIQSKYSNTPSPIPTGIGSGGSLEGFGARADPTQPSAAMRDLQDYRNELNQGVKDGMISPDQASSAYSNATNRLAGGQPLLGSSIPDGGIAGANPAPTRIRQEFLDSISTVNFANGQDINKYFMTNTGMDFIDWFNKTQAGKGYWGNQKRSFGDWADSRFISGNDPFGDHSLDVSMDVVKQRFEIFWDRIPIIYSPAGQIGLVQFVALMSITINERNGNLVSRGEGGDLKYMFRYNKGPNIKAFDLFNNPVFWQTHQTKAGSTLKNTSDSRWGTTTYPSGISSSTDPAITGFIQEADFFKFRGRGVIQTTWRNAYIDLISFIQTYTGSNTIIQKYCSLWAGQDVNNVATQSSNSDWDQLFGEIDFVAHAIDVFNKNKSKGDFLTFDLTSNELNSNGPGSIRNMGSKIGWRQYGELFYNRVVQILNALGNDPNITIVTPVPGGGAHI